MQLANPVSESTLEAVLAASPLAALVATLGADPQILAVNQKFTALFGYEPREVSGPDCWWSLAFPDATYRSEFRSAWSSAVLGATRGQAPDRPIEARVRCRDGSLRDVEFHIGVQAGRAFALCNDVTARRRAELDLMEARGFLQAVVDTSPSAIFVVDEKGRLVFINRHGANVYGSTPEEMVSKSTEDLHPLAEEAAGFVRDDQEVIRTGKELVREEAATLADGSQYWIHTVKVPLVKADGRVLCLGISTDVTARKRAEEARLELEAKMWQSQKLESLGVLAGGIAHDFNNLLASIRTNAHLIRTRLPSDAAIQQQIEGIDAATERAARLTEQMLVYIGQGQSSVATVSLADAVTELNPLFEAVLSKKARVCMELEPVLVEADAAQLQQIILNLITNASDALGEGSGGIVVRTGTRELEGEALRSAFVSDAPPAGRYAVLEVEDDGCGMAAATLARIFEPFYSTKFPGRGLGLSAVLGIVRAHRGTVQVQSQLGQGTCVRVLLPQAFGPAVARPTPPVTSAPQAAPATGGTLLVIDDEALVRTTTCMALEDSGFRVHSAADGQAGVELFARFAGEIDAVILDLTMPVLGGWQCLDQLRAIRADIPVILISGYAADTQVPPHVNPVPRFLRKPFDPDELAREVAALVANGRAQRPLSRAGVSG